MFIKQNILKDPNISVFYDFLKIMPNITAFFEDGTLCEFSAIDNLHA